MSGIYRGVNGSAVADALNLDGDKGDIVVSNSGAEWRVDSDSITFAKMQEISADVLIGNTGTPGNPIEIPCTAAGRALLDDANAAAQRTTLGLANGATATIGTDVLAYDANLQGFVNTFTLPTVDSTNGFVLTTNGTGTLSLTAPGGIADGDKGDITVATGGTVWTIDNGVISTAKVADDAITYAKIQNVSATDKLLGRTSVGAGDIEEITCTSAGRALLDDIDNVAQRTTLGLGALSTLNTVGTAQIDNLAVTNDKVATNTLALSKLTRVGTSGQVLTSAGAGADASYTTLNSISQLDSSDTITDSGTNGQRTLTIDGVVRETQTALARMSTIDGSSTLYPEFKCRAWVNFTGTGTVAIRASGNVSSITDNGTGDYTINFATALPDVNYCVAGITTGTTTANTSRNLVIKGTDAGGATLKTTTQLAVQTANLGTIFVDMAEVNVVIFR